MHEPFSPLVKNTRRVKRLGKKLGSNKGLNKQTDFQNQDTYILLLSKTLLFLKKLVILSLTGFLMILIFKKSSNPNPHTKNTYLCIS